MNQVITIVSGRPGIRDRSKPLWDVVRNARELDANTGSLPPEFDSRIHALVQQSPGHRVTDGGIDLAVVVFPMTGLPQLATISLAHPTSAGKKPMLYSGDAIQTQRIVTMLLGDEHDMGQNVYASIAAFRGSRTLCLIPENHPMERQILARLDIELVQMNATGDRKRVFFHTKVFGAGASYSKSQCHVSHPMFRMWFPRHSCQDIYAQCNVFYPGSMPDRPRAVQKHAPKVQGGVSKRVAPPTGMGKGASFLRGKGLHGPGMGKQLMSTKMMAQSLPSGLDTYKKLMNTLIVGKVQGLLHEDIDDTEWIKAQHLLTLLRDASADEDAFAVHMAGYRDMDISELVENLLTDQWQLTKVLDAKMVNETMAELSQVIEQLS
jgi:hypothetical protein